jgi:predicted phosphodiesterase
MLLLHIADIHFTHPICLTPNDPDRPYRTRLVQDARAEVRRLGRSVDAILVGGDIAFKGAREEYEAALAWLTELAGAVGCPVERIFVVPGNHDVNRNLARAPATRNAQTAIKNATSAGNRERELREQFRDAETGRALLAPIAAYNEFAARFACQLYSPERLFWTVDLPLASGVALRMYGLTSTILSGFGGNDDPRAGLYLGPDQTVFDPVDNVVHLVMSHHTPNWFMDHDEIDDALRRTQVQFFGHEHRQRLTREVAYVRFNAGAVNPERHEAGWQPGYNLVELTVEERNGHTYLDVAAHLRAWQPPDSFQAVIDTFSQTNVHRHSVQLRNVTIAPPPPTSAVPASPDPVQSEPRVPTEQATNVPEASMAEEMTRRLIYRFWDLTASQRREICLRLNLITEQDIALPEPERYGRALKKAREMNLLAALATEIQQAEQAARS